MRITQDLSFSLTFTGNTLSCGLIRTPLQDYTHILSDLLEGGISLHPITAAIQELAAAAIETLEEAKVRYQTLNFRYKTLLDNFSLLKPSFFLPK